MSSDTTYAVTVTFTVHADSDEHLQSPQAIQEEVGSWLEGLRATVHDVTVREGDEKETTR